MPIEVDTDWPLEECIVLTQSEGEAGWSAHDVEAGVASFGDTREEALEMLDEAVALHRGEIGHEPTDEELRELDIDPSNNENGSLDDSEIFE